MIIVTNNIIIVILCFIGYRDYLKPFRLKIAERTSQSCSFNISWHRSNESDSLNSVCHEFFNLIILIAFKTSQLTSSNTNI